MSRLKSSTAGRVSFAVIAASFLAAASGHLTADGPPDDSSRWEKAITAFEETDAKEPPPKNGIVFVGSSSIRLWKLDDHFPDRLAINRGFGGSEISDSIHFAERIVIKHEPRLVLLYAGDNDIARGKSADRVRTDFERFVETVHAKLPETEIAFIAIKPSIKRWELAGEMRKANEQIAKLCGENERLAYIDIWKPMLGDDGRPREELFVDDGLHLNEQGYRLWAKAVRPHLK